MELWFDSTTEIPVATYLSYFITRETENISASSKSAPSLLRLNFLIDLCSLMTSI